MSPATIESKLSLEEKRALAARLVKERGIPPRAASPLVHRIVEGQARRTPRATAVTCGPESLDYGTLNSRANVLAGRLRALGVGWESPVGVHLHRSTELLVAVLAVLKAGGAYVPLDPLHPAERLRMMMADAGVRFLLSDQGHDDPLPNSGTLIVDPRASHIEPAPGNDGDLSGDPSPLGLAYIIYTSGSTGRPKGVQVTHQALSNLLRSMRAVTGIGDRDALLALTTLAFDISALELLLPLTVGARIELAGEHLASQGAVLASRLGDPAITFAQATPATWRMLLDSGWQGNPRLTVLCGGDALSRPLADRLLEKAATVWNVYGPTETTVWSTAWRVEPGGSAISIGRPLTATQLYVLDRRLRPVPVGVTGELHIGGVGLARGYRNRPGLTAERFLPDPFDPAGGGRLYATGDLARWRPDGTLECLGRIDHQVKVRGHRIELGEIEAVLAGHPRIRDAAASTYVDGTGELSLAAYIVLKDGAGGLGIGELRAWLGQRLPESMLPALLVELPALPLTPGGKVDRKSLPDPSLCRGKLAASDAAPRGSVEQAVAGIMAELLGVEQVGAHSNFFELGGHSLTAIQLLARIRHTFQAEVPVRNFLDAPTAAQLADLVERARASGLPAAEIHVPRSSRARQLPASFAQQRLWYLEQLDPGSSGYAIPVALMLEGTLDVPALEQALNRVVERHESLRTTFHHDGESLLQVIEAERHVELMLDDLSGLGAVEQESEVAHLLAAESHAPFDLARGPLIRARLLCLAPDRHVALVTMHHIASDGWSMGILVREVSALYQAARAGLPDPLPPMALQYADYAAWQRRQLSGGALELHLAYWRDRLEGVPDLELPTDRIRSPGSVRPAGTLVRILPPPLLEAARALGRGCGATLYMTLLAAFQALLHRYSGQDDFAIGTPIAGRTRLELEPLIGCFVNTLALRAELAGNPGFRELLARVRLAAIDAYAHQDLPFEKLVEELQPRRGPARSPIFQVMFALQNAPAPALESPELALRPLPTAPPAAKFELTLFAAEATAGLELTLEYDAGLFEPATAGRLLGHYQALLESAAADPDMPVGSLPMLSPLERQLLLQQGHDGDGDADDASFDLDQLDEEELGSLIVDSYSGEAASHE
jgi:amino acid adenylation domain-containing protein